jgi:hypothetical protein
MATQIVIGNESNIKIDDTFHIDWVDRGNAMPALPSTVHYVIWNNLAGQNEIQHKDASTGNMTGNTDLSSVSDAVGDTTVQALLDWGQTRQQQIEIAMLQDEEAETQAQVDWEADPNNDPNQLPDWTKTWRDYDPNYS